MSDIVERLRNDNCGEETIKEAADKIEWLLAATVRLSEEINELRQERERLRIELKAAHAGLGGLQETVERLRMALVEIGHVLSADPLEGSDAHAEILAIIGEALSGCHVQSQNG